MPVPPSTLSDIFKEKEKWLNIDIGGGGWKKKQRTAQFPLLEEHLVEWVDRANHKRVAINDFVLKVAAEELVSGLSSVSMHPEDYTDFVFPNGWLHRVKQRYALRDKKMRGEGVDIDTNLLPAMQQDLINRLEDFALRDVFNCDKLALQ